MKRWKKAGVGFLIVLGVIVAINMVHELGHYLINRHYGNEVREICFLGVEMTEHQTPLNLTAGWTLIGYDNDRKMEQAAKWDNIWDLGMA